MASQSRTPKTSRVVRFAESLEPTTVVSAQDSEAAVVLSNLGSQGTTAPPRKSAMKRTISAPSDEELPIRRSHRLRRQGSPPPAPLVPSTAAVASTSPPKEVIHPLGIGSP